MTEGRSITVGEAIAFKAGLNDSITYGRSGMNAQQLRAFMKMTTADWQSVRRARSEFSGDYAPPRWLAHLVALMAVAATLFLPGMTRALAAAVLVWYAAKWLLAIGHAAGYLAGYDLGREEGIRNAFGIAAADLLDAADREIDMDLETRDEP